MQHVRAVKISTVILHGLLLSLTTCLSTCRAAQFLHQMTDPETLDETQTLTLFLAKQYPIRDGLKEQLVEIPGFEDLLADVINTCVVAYENKFYLMPSEKHLLVKVSVCDFQIYENYPVILLYVM